MVEDRPNFVKRFFSNAWVIGIGTFVLGSLILRWVDNWASDNLDTSDFARIVNNAISPIVEGLARAWHLLVDYIARFLNYAQGQPDVPRWLFAIVLVAAVVPALRAVSRASREGRIRRAFEEAWSYMTEMTVGDFIRTTFDFKYAEEHRKRWKENREKSSAGESDAASTADDTNALADREIGTLRVLSEPNLIDNEASAATIAARLKVNQHVATLAAHRLVELGYARESLHSGDVFYSLTPNGTEQAICLGIIQDFSAWQSE